MNDFRSLGQTYLERVLPLVLRDNNFQEAFSRFYESDTSHEKNKSIEHLVALLVADTLTTTVGVPTNVLAISTLISRILLNARLSENDFKDTQLLEQVNEFVDRASKIDNTDELADAKIASIVRQAIEDSNTLPRKLQSAFIAVILGITSSASYDVFKTIYSEQDSMAEVFGPSYTKFETRKITGDGLRLREKPNIDSTVIGSLGIGEEVNLYDIRGDWYMIRTNDNRIGWVHSTYVSPSLPD